MKKTKYFNPNKGRYFVVQTFVSQKGWEKKVEEEKCAPRNSAPYYQSGLKTLKEAEKIVRQLGTNPKMANDYKAWIHIADDFLTDGKRVWKKPSSGKFSK